MLDNDHFHESVDITEVMKSMEVMKAIKNFHKVYRMSTGSLQEEQGLVPSNEKRQQKNKRQEAPTEEQATGSANRRTSGLPR